MDCSVDVIGRGLDRTQEGGRLETGLGQSLAEAVMVDTRMRLDPRRLDCELVEIGIADGVQLRCRPAPEPASMQVEREAKQMRGGVACAQVETLLCVDRETG